MTVTPGAAGAGGAGAAQQGSSVRGGICFFSYAAAWLLGVLIVGHQVFLNFGQSLFEREASQFAAGVGFFFVVVILVAALVGVALTAKNVNRATVIVCASLLAAKLFWVWTHTTTQSNDFEQYWNYGKALAEHDTKWLQDSTHLFKRAFFQRALLYTYPIFSFFGVSETALELGNVFLQMGSCALLFSLVKRHLGIRSGLVSAIIYSIYPDQWFAATFASHDIPAMFWLLLCLLLLDRLIIPGESLSQIWRKNAVRFPAFAFLGASVAALEVQRSYLPFVAGAVCMAAWFFVWKPGATTLFRKVCFARKGLTMVFTAISLFCGFFTVRVPVSIYAGQLAPVSLIDSSLGYVSAGDSATTGEISSMLPWRMNYFRAIPEGERTAFALRKLVHEKLASGSMFWNHLVKKSAVLAGSDTNMMYSYSGVPGMPALASWQVTWLSCKQVLCRLVTGALLLLLFVRLWTVPILSPSEGPCMAFSLSACIVLLALTEALPTYDMFLALPVALSGALITSLSATSRTGDSKTSRPAWRRLFVPGSGVLIVVVSLHLVAGRWATSAGWGFSALTNIELIPEIALSKRRQVSAEVSLTPEAAAISFRSAGRLILKSGDWTAASFQLTPGNQPSSHTLKLFLSADQRRRGQWEGAKYTGIPVRYAIFVGAREVCRGSIEEIANPVFLEAPSDTLGAGKTVTVSILLEAVADWYPNADLATPIVAIEYPH